MGRLKNEKIRKFKKQFLTITGVLILMTTGISCYSCASDGSSSVKGEAKWAGCRSSQYGIRPFPSPSGWTSYVNKMKSNYKGSKGALIWIVGGVTEAREKVDSEYWWNCRLNFPANASDLAGIPESSLTGIRFADEDENEAYLTAFDKAGYDVWLQVESGKCDLEALAQIVMNHYKNHPCVKGFGIDVEWYNPSASKDNNRGYGTKLSASLAEKVDKKVKAANPNYSVFVKHWDSKWLPKTFPKDMIFVNDSQQFDSLEDLKGDFQYWASLYAPNPVFFQIGYDEDEDLWGTLSNPAKDLGNLILDGLDTENQDIGIIWVDFTLKSVL